MSQTKPERESRLGVCDSHEGEHVRETKFGPRRCINWRPLTARERAKADKMAKGKQAVVGAVEASLEAAHNFFQGHGPTGQSLADAVRKVTPADAQAALDSLLAAAIERCADTCKEPMKFTGGPSPATRAAWKACEDAIRALTPASIREGAKKNELATYSARVESRAWEQGRLQGLLEAAEECDGAQRDRWQAKLSDAETRKWNTWVTELGTAIRNHRNNPSQFDYIAAAYEDAKAIEARARLAEAKWWEHLVGAVNEGEQCKDDCMYCERIAQLESAARESGGQT